MKHSKDNKTKQEVTSTSMVNYTLLLLIQLTRRRNKRRSLTIPSGVGSNTIKTKEVVCIKVEGLVNH